MASKRFQGTQLRLCHFTAIVFDRAVSPVVKVEHQFIGLHDEIWKVRELCGSRKCQRLQRMLQVLKNPVLALLFVHFRRA